MHLRNKSVSSWKHEKDVLFRVQMKTWVVRQRDFQRSCGWLVSAENDIQLMPAFVLDLIYSRTMAFFAYSVVGRQKIGRNQVFDDVYYLQM